MHDEHWRRTKATLIRFVAKGIFFIFLKGIMSGWLIVRRMCNLFSCTSHTWRVGISARAAASLPLELDDLGGRHRLIELYKCREADSKVRILIPECGAADNYSPSSRAFGHFEPLGGRAWLWQADHPWRSTPKRALLQTTRVPATTIVIIPKSKTPGRHTACHRFCPTSRRPLVE